MKHWAKKRAFENSRVKENVDTSTLHKKSS